MCGIAGFSGAFDLARLRAASEAIAHRGPDGDGLWARADGSVALAHRRLSIIDLSSTGAQPMHSDDDAVVITFNGEIFNYRELRDELTKQGVQFRGASDTEVLLQLYLRYGCGMLDSLNGIFAFAIWDRRDESLLLARDALGVKPLYYGESSAGFAFASEIKALLHLLPSERTLDSASLHRYMTFLWCPGSGTPLRNVKKLLPGEALLVRGKKISRQWTWYRLPVHADVPGPVDVSHVVQETVNKLRSAVHRQMVSDVPLGAFLSGGLDSSAIVSFAREVNPDISCFTIESTGGVDDGVIDDVPYATQVADHLRVPLDVVKIDAASMAKDLESMVFQLDEPLADPAPLNVLYISRVARQRGVKVLLSGVGGDDLFSGYRRHLALRYEELWSWMPRHVRSAIEQGTSRLDQRNPVFRQITKLFTVAGLQGDERLAAYFAWTREKDLLQLYTQRFAAALGDTKATEPMMQFLGSIPRETRALDRMLALEQRFFLADHNLIYSDKMSMAAGVEVRVPMLDLDLVRFSATVPAALKQHGAVGKWILKRAMEPFLPRDVIYRPKSGFGAPLRRWMRNELRPLLGDILSEQSLRRRGLFEPKAVHELIARNDAGKVDAAYTLLSLLTIEIWCRKFIDDHTPQERALRVA
jgi:asparagine synthase (glutamine-hydrolysing)